MTRGLSNSSSRHHLGCAVLSVPILLLASYACPGASPPIEPDPALLQAAADAPAVDVARSLCSAKLALKVSEYAELGANVTVVVGATEITRENIGQVRKDMEQRIATYEVAIRQRGTADIAGTYRAMATNCTNSGSLLASAISEGLRDASVTQVGPAFGLALRGKIRGKKEKLDADGCVAENTLALTDPVESGYTYIGEATEGRLLIRPDVETILSGMFPPADRATLEACLVTLERPAKP
jgi:hypothetical protein